MIGFYKLTAKEYEDFVNFKTFAIPTLDPYKLFPKDVSEKETKKSNFIEAFDFNDIKDFSQDFKILKEKKEDKFYIIVDFYDYMV